jgi:hypothetical protein
MDTSLVDNTDSAGREVMVTTDAVVDHTIQTQMGHELTANDTIVFGDGGAVDGQQPPLQTSPLDGGDGDQELRPNQRQSIAGVDDMPDLMDIDHNQCIGAQHNDTVVPIDATETSDNHPKETMNSVTTKRVMRSPVKGGDDMSGSVGGGGDGQPVLPAMDRSLRSSHLREVQQLKTDIQKLKSELTQFRRQKTNVRLKNKRLNQLKAENEKLVNELLFSQKINEILVKFKEYFEEKWATMGAGGIDSDQPLVELRNEYKNTLSERQTIAALNKNVDLKYKLYANEFNSKSSAGFVHKSTYESIIGMYLPFCGYI